VGDVGGSGTRAEKALRARALRARGMHVRDIAATMGAAPGTVRAWLNDPDGSKLRARKDSYRGACRECGAPTDGSSGRQSAPTLCAAHSLEALNATRAPSRHVLTTTVALYEAGEPVRDIAQRLEVDRATVYRYLRTPLPPSRKPGSGRRRAEGSA
jgi:transposase